MRLTYIHNARIPGFQANSVQVIKTCEALAKKGVDLTLIIPKMKKMKELPDENIWKYYNLKKRFKFIKLPTLDLLWFFNKKTYSKKFLVLRYYIQNFTFAISCFIYLLFTKKEIIYTRDFNFVLSLICFFKKRFCKK
ncbi:hypothetical protein CL621_02615, partial [archaeon]|nr:hypothetical protein [archaeon]